jgi:predicted glycosyltransferase
MVQIDKQTKMSKEVLAQKDPSKNENLTVDKIMDLRGELWKVTMESGEYVKDNRGLVTKFILSQAIKDNYEGKIETSYDRSDTAEWINNFIDYLMAHYRDEFLIRPYEIKKNSYINNLYMFYGFIALSKKLQGNKDWKESLKQKINSIDFNKTNGLWRDIGLVGEKNINKTTKNKLYNLFIEE